MKLTIGDRVCASAAYLEKYPSSDGPSRLTGVYGTIIADPYGDGSRFEVNFGISAPVGKDRSYPTWILRAAELVQVCADCAEPLESKSNGDVVCRNPKCFLAEVLR